MGNSVRIVDLANEIIRLSSYETGKDIYYKHITAQIDELTKISDTFDTVAIKKKLKEIVPEYVPQF